MYLDPFYSCQGYSTVILDGSNKFKKKLCLALSFGIWLSRSVCSPNGGDFVEQLLGRLIFTKLRKKNTVTYTIPFVVRISSLILDKFY